MPLRSFIQKLQKQYQLDKREIEIVICHVLNTNTAGLFIYEKELKQHQLNKIHQLLEKRKLGIPFAYLTGVKDFWSLTLKVNEHTLIPRPETELIIEYILDKTKPDFDGSILDLGTGTGAIALSLALERPKAKIIAVDRCIKCVETALINRENHHLSNVEIFQSDWFENLKGYTFDFILSNPPYIAKDDKHLSDLKFEPLTALVADNNGYSDLEHIINYAKNYMMKTAELVLEHGHNQSEVVQQKLLANCYLNVKSHPDLAGIQRITTADAPKSCY
jgi:release factor glutamine methyltransferase